MTMSLELPPPSARAESKGGRWKWLATLGLLTLLAAATGGGFGVVMVSRIEKRVEEKHKAALEKVASSSPYSGDIAIRKLSPVVTNLGASDDQWIRLEASIIYKINEDLNPDVLVAETRQDVLSYIRTLTLSQIQGASGLLHLREDLNERARLRSKGIIQELVVEGLVIQ